MLIFRQFVKCSDGLEMTDNENGAMRIWMEVPMIVKFRVQLFQENDDVKSSLLFKAARFSLTHCGRLCVYFGISWWNPAIEAQAGEESPHWTSETCILLYKFITKNSVKKRFHVITKPKTSRSGFRRPCS